MAFKNGELDAYNALDNGVAAYTQQNWLPSIIEAEYRKARNSAYYKAWYEGLSEKERDVADEIAKRL